MLTKKTFAEMLGGDGVVMQLMVRGVVFDEVCNVGVDGMVNLFGENTANAEIKDVVVFGICFGRVVGVKVGGADSRFIRVRWMNHYN